jgi:hypothetical protein
LAISVGKYILGDEKVSFDVPTNDIPSCPLMTVRRPKLLPGTARRLLASLYLGVHHSAMRRVVDGIMSVVDLSPTYSSHNNLGRASDETVFQQGDVTWDFVAILPSRI